jgi:hypothetical protein
MNNLLKTTFYHKLCAYNPKTDTTLWLQNYRIRGGEVTLWFTSNPKECALLVVDLDQVVNESLGMDYILFHRNREDFQLLNWL